MTVDGWASDWPRPAGGTIVNDGAVIGGSRTPWIGTYLQEVRSTLQDHITVPHYWEKANQPWPS